MNILFDLGHPAHVHLFRNAAHSLMQRGHSVSIAIRDKPIIKNLLDFYGLEYSIASKARSGSFGLAYELIEHDFNVLRLVRQNKIDLMAGTSASVAHVSRITRAKSFVFSEDDAAVVPLFARVTYPFADKVVVPVTVSDARRNNYICHNSLHELAYLHPNHFEADRSILEALGVADGEPYVIVRLVALQAHHDVGEIGITPELQHKLVSLIANHARVFVTCEAEVPEWLSPYQLPIVPHRMHDAMALARLVVSDSQTMTAEAAVLGVPSVRCNTFVRRLGYLDELEDRFGLTFGFLPSQSEDILHTVALLLTDETVPDMWQRRRAALLAEKIDFHLWMVRLLESECDG